MTKIHGSMAAVSDAIKRKGLVFKVREKLHHYIIKILWKSQKKQFKHIGQRGGVLELPYISGYRNITIGDNYYFGKDVRIEAWERYGTQAFSPRIIIGNNVVFTDRCYLSCIDRIEIGDGALFGRDVFIADNSHGDSSPDILGVPPLKRPLFSKGPVVIGRNVWVGRQVTILSGVTIGDNSIIGANSVVNKDIPANCVAAGNPARIIKYIKSA